MSHDDYLENKIKVRDAIRELRDNVASDTIISEEAKEAYGAVLDFAVEKLDDDELESALVVMLAAKRISVRLADYHDRQAEKLEGLL